MNNNKLLFILALFFTSNFGYSQFVTNSAELNDAIDAATAGITIILTDGTWNNVFNDWLCITN